MAMTPLFKNVTERDAAIRHKISVFNERVPGNRRLRLDPGKSDGVRLSVVEGDKEIFSFPFSARRAEGLVWLVPMLRPVDGFDYNLRESLRVACGLRPRDK